ncbi:MAG TPA: hypothetical protein H9829_09120 [Candidatus Tetragenococcus pullicola]|nr:hypothetical protein [Candidatus Tetragenococcus pullicola]
MNILKKIGPFFVGLILLSACSATNDTNDTSETTLPEETASISSETESSQEAPATFTATVTSLTEEEQEMQLYLENVEAIDDPDNITASFETEGVIFNLSGDESDELSELEQGMKVQVTLKGLPIMTMSIPPQVPGQYIEELKIIE